ncbi:MAG: FAD-dependent oxidoreductase, partial [Terrimicrobiaceae bacterium]
MKKKRGAVRERARSAAYAWAFNSAEMQIELDELVLEHRVAPWLHTSFVAPHVKNGKLEAVIVENKSGRGALRARFFIDATGDGDLCQRLGLETYRSGHRQPSTTCATFSGWGSLEKTDWGRLLREHASEYGLPDGIANGSYRVDIHHDDKPGITFRYLDGRESYVRPGFPPEEGRWRPAGGVNPTFYQIPYRSLLPLGKHANLLVAGRFIDADEQAHAAIRVMVNMNQTGEAAGTAAFLALKNDQCAAGVDPELLRRMGWTPFSNQQELKISYG